MDNKARRGMLSRESLSSATAILIYLSALKLLLHFLTNGGYGYFRDELYYIACGERLDWGYADQSPMIGLAARATRLALGDSLFALRSLPAVAGALTVFLTGWMARELGGGRAAAAISAVAVIISPYFLSINTILTMNAFEPLFWLGCAYTLVLIIKRGDEKLWMLFGLIAGLGLMNKHSMLFFGFALVAGLALTPQRKFLFNRWLLLGGLIAFVIFLPNVIWQIRHDWATLELLRNAQENQTYHAPVTEFFMGQLLMTHPFAFPVWLAGLLFYFFSPAGKPYRALGWGYLIMFALMVALNGKVYYLAPIYPILLAPGAVAIERAASRRGRGWLKPVTAAALIAGGIITAPLTLPVLPVETFITYANALGSQEGVKTENLEMGRLPQHYADMFGWEEMTALVAEVYNSLPPEERARCAIFASNYGEAGAIDFFGRAYNLPKAISGHQNYYLWGPRDYTGEVVITIGEDFEDVSKTFDRVELAATFNHPYAIPHENNSPIYVCRGPKMSLKEVWPDVKCFSC